MMITENIRFSSVIKITWKAKISLLAICTASFFIYNYFLSPYLQISGIFASVLGTALAFFIGFKNNQAYDRWWEARKIWGALVNDSRSWARNILSYSNAQPDKSEELASMQKQLIRRHIAFVYILKERLREGGNKYYRKYISEEDVSFAEQHTNSSNALLIKQSEGLEELSKLGYIDGFRFAGLNSMVVKFCDEMGMSERIKTTVFPPTYHYFTKIFIWLFVVMITFMSVEDAGAGSILIGWLVGVVFHDTHQIGMLILEPFKPRQSGISLDQISRTIEIDLLEMIGEQDIPEAVKSVNGEYVM